MIDTTNAVCEELRLDNQICFPLYVCAKEIVRQYRKPLEELNLTYTQYLVMMVLWEHGGMTEGQLGKIVHLESGTLTPVLRRLEKAGYIVGLSVDDACRASFSFTSRRIKELLTKAGEIVEIFVYCEALKTGFDDIRKGFGFSWYGSRVENELDIVLTKGFCSMIIEVKAVEKLDMNYYHKLMVL